MRRRLVITSLAMMLVVVVGALSVHTPPVRSLALRYAIRFALDRGIQLQAERLDYNIVTRHVRLANVKVSAVGDAQPFFLADEVFASVASSIFFGNVLFDEVAVTNGVVQVVRRTNGTTNLPRGSGTASTTDPAPLPIARVIAPRLAIEYDDQSANVAFRTAALSVDLSSRGQLTLNEPAELRIGETSTQFTTLEGNAAFDGRDLRLSGMRIEIPEFRGQVDGTLALIRREPSFDVRVSGDVELENAARWWDGADDAPRGSIHLEGTVSGPFGAPVANLAVGSTAMSWRKLEVRDLAGPVRLDTDSVEVGESRASIGGGQVNARGSLSWANRAVQIGASWQEVDAASIVTALSGAAITPTGRASGDLTATGSIDSIEAWDIDAGVALSGGQNSRGRLTMPGEADFHLTAGQWTLDARHVVGNVTTVDVALMGKLRGPDFADSAVSGTLRASESDLSAILQMLSEAGIASVRQDLVTGALRASADVDGIVRRPVLRFVVESDTASVAGQEVVGIQGRGRLDGSTLDIEELSAAQPEAPVQGAPSGRILVAGQYDFTGETYKATVKADAWRLVATPELPVSGPVNLEYSGQGRGTMVFGTARVTADLVVEDDIDVGEIAADVDLQGDHANFTAVAPEYNAKADGTIGFEAPYHASVRVNAQALDLARAVRGIDLPITLEGTADVLAEAEGPLERWREGRGSVQLNALNGTVQTLPIALREPARALYDGSRVIIERLEGSIGKTSLSVVGSLPLEDGAPATDAVLATLTGDLYDVAVAAAVAAKTPDRESTEPPIAAGNGPLILLARITGSLQNPTYAADLEIGPGMVQARADLAPVENLQVRAHLENGLVELRNFRGTYHGANVNATGQAPLALFTGDQVSPGDGQAALHATAVGVTSAVLAPFVDESTISQVAGSLDARVDLTSPTLNLEGLEGEVVLERLSLTVADLPVTQRMPTRVVARDGFARVESWIWESEGTSFEVTGQVRLSDQDAALQANGTLDARLLTPFLGQTGIATAGQVNTRLLITGAITDPTINGDARLANGELRLREPRIVASELNAAVELTRGNAFLTSLSGTVNGGMLSGSGQVQYAPELRGQFTLNVTGMAMDFPEGLRTEEDSTLELTTTVKDGVSASRLSGLVTVRRGAYREPLAIITGVLANLQRSGTTTGRAPSPFLQSLALDIRVITDEDIAIDNNVAEAQLGADLRLINVASSPALSGRMELREGGQLFLGRNTYIVQSGAIDFVNPSTIEPILGIVAVTRVAGVEIEVRLTGPPNNLMTELTSPSDPDLGQADLTSLLLTGRRMDELGEEQAAIVGAQVLGNLAGDVLGFAGRAVGLDTLRFGSETNPRDPAELASEVDPTSRITFGKSLGSKLDVTLSQSLVESNAQTWIIDYLPVRRLSLRFVSDDQDLRSYAFRHDVTFGTAPAPIRSADASREVTRPRVTAVRLMGDLRFPESQVRDVLRMKEGDRFDSIDWQQDRDRLERFYHRQRHLAARIATARQEESDGVVLDYTINAGPETAVRVTGATLPTSAIGEIETAWAQSVFEGFLIEEAEAIVRRELARQGAYQPMLEVRIEGDESTRTLVVDVTPSPRAERIEVRFEGVEEPLAAELRGQFSGRDHSLQALTDPREFERTMLTFLRSRGYAQAGVSVGVPTFEETVAFVPVTVNPGPQFRIGVVNFEGAKGIALADLRLQAGLQEGAFYRADDVERARTDLQTRYRRDGFSMASVEAREDVRAQDSVVDVVFSIEEGARQVIQEITVDGLRSVAADVVRRSMRLTVGDPVRTADWLEARRRLFESGLFRRVDIAVEPLEGGTDTTPTRVRVTVEEWPALRLRYGFQVAEERPEENVEGRDLVPGVSADLTRRTLFGRAMTVGVAGQYERLERLGRLFLTTPTFLGRPIQSSLTLERSREESQTNTLVSSQTTAAWEQRARFRRLTLSYGLRFERNRTFDTDPDPLFPFDLTAHIGRLTSSGTWDTRDDAADATRGTFVSSSLEHGTSRLGSDLLFLRSLTQAYHFRPWRSVVFASAARFGAVKPLEGQVLLSSLRFFAGGGRTVRGVAEDSLGGLDFLGDPVGGRGLLTFNQEVRFPIYGWLRGVTFLDIGNVFPLVSDIRLNDLVGSTGFGLRLVTPFALFRLDYGRTIWNRPIADSGKLVFGIGQAF